MVGDPVWATGVGVGGCFRDTTECNGWDNSMWPVLSIHIGRAGASTTRVLLLPKLINMNTVKHCARVLIFQYSYSYVQYLPQPCIWVNIGSGNSLLPDGTKLLPEPILTYDIINWMRPIGIELRAISQKLLSVYHSHKVLENYLFENSAAFLRGQWVSRFRNFSWSMSVLDWLCGIKTTLSHYEALFNV